MGGGAGTVNPYLPGKSIPAAPPGKSIPAGQFHTCRAKSIPAGPPGKSIPAKPGTSIPARQIHTCQIHTCRVNPYLPGKSIPAAPPGKSIPAGQTHTCRADLLLKSNSSIRARSIFIRVMDPERPRRQIPKVFVNEDPGGPDSFLIRVRQKLLYKGQGPVWSGPSSGCPEVDPKLSPDCFKPNAFLLFPSSRSPISGPWPLWPL